MYETTAECLAGGGYPNEPPARVHHPVMLQRWDSLLSIHWRYPVQQVQPLLPGDLTVDAFDGSAWVGLIPFRMEHVRPRGVPAVLPWIGTFPEANLRTYTRDRNGVPGVWFLSLDISRLAAVWIARSWYRLNYCWAQAAMDDGGGRFHYRTRRRWPGRRGAGAFIGAEVGHSLIERDVTELDHFLANRWGLHTTLRKGTAFAPVEHGRWRLHEARLTQLDEDLIAAAGLPAPVGEPVVRYSPGVDVRIGKLGLVR